MEYVAGGTLRPYTEAENLLPPDRIADIIFRVASALEYATSEGLLHRDVKPANILLDEHGAPRVSDFGSAYILTSTETQISDVGTLPYMPPEHFSGKAPGVQTDIYALGVTAYELLTGAYPFEGSSTERDDLPQDERCGRADRIAPAGRAGGLCRHHPSRDRPRSGQAIRALA